MFVLVLCGVIAAQVEVQSNCPSISVTGPAGIVQPGEIGRYTAHTSEKGQNLNFKYFWSTSAGEIVSGQGTKNIEVKFPSNSGITVTIEVTGLPKGCPATASEIAIWDPALSPVKLAQFRGPSFTEDKRLSEDIAQAVKDYRDNQLYIIVGYKQNTDEESVRTRERRVTEFVLNSTPEINYDRSRITVVRYAGSVDVIEIWRVPPGAENPVCEECGKASCPEITVTGPAGMTPPGDTMTFTINPPTVDFEKLTIRWNVSAGTIIEGQGKPFILVRTAPEKDAGNITASVEIDGLSRDCTGTASATAKVGSGDPPLLAEITFTSLAEIRAQLDSVARSVKGQPEYFLYMIMYKSKLETETRVKRREVFIRNYLTTNHKIPVSRIVFVNGGERSPSVKVYLVPPDSKNRQ